MEIFKTFCFLISQSNQLIVDSEKDGSTLDNSDIDSNDEHI